MSDNFKLPTPDDITAVLTMLFGHGTSAKEADALDASSVNVFTATFVDDDDQLVATCSCDAFFAAYAGGSLSMVPAGGAEDMAKTNDFMPVIIDNLHEIMNILSTAYMSDTTGHLRLCQLYKGGEVPEDAKQAIADSLNKNGMSVEVPGYGAGALTLVTI